MADPLAGGSSSSSCEPKTEYDEELDLFSSKFNPERALYSPDVVVPYPDIKSFGSVKSYEDAIKSRSKSRAAAESKSKKNVETPGGKPHQTESAAHDKAQQSKRVKSLSSEATTSCDKPIAALESVEKRMERQGKSPSYDSHTESTPHTTEEEALDLSLKASPVLTQAVPMRTGSPPATPSSNYGKLSNYSSSREEDKQYQKSSLKDKPQLSVRSHSSRERSVGSSSRSAEASGSRETSKKSHSAVRSDNSGLTPVKNLSKSEKHLRVSGSTDEKRSHSASSHYSEKQHYELSRSHERSSRDTYKLSRSNEKSADTPVRSQERGSKHSKRPASTFFFSSKKTERPLDVSGGEHEPRVIASTSHSYPEKRHSEKKQSLQTQTPRPVASRLPKTPVDYKKEIPPAEVTDSSAGKKSQKDKMMRNVFVRMEKMIGPLHVLTRCVQERLHIRVMTRGAVAVKSVCRGYVVAFDKHFNMALVDVDEIYRRPAVLGKIKSKRSQKLLAAQTTLQKEREGYLAKWSDEQSLQRASSSLQDLSLEPSCSKDQKFSSHVSKHQEELPTAGTNPSVQLASASLDHPGSGEEEAQSPFNKLSKSAQAKLFRIQSVYEDHKVPLSPFEREALMLGIADENVVHRHINQMLIRGENVVSVSIIEDI